MALDKIIGLYDVETKKAEESLKEIQKDWGDVEKANEQATETANKNFKGLADTAKKVGAVLVAAFGVQQLIRFGKELNTLAVQQEAFLKRAQTVFKQYTNIVQNFAQENANALGLTQNEFVGAAAAIGDILVPLGLARRRAAELSTEAIKLGVAIKRFAGDQRSAAEISQIVARSLTGETEALKGLGIIVQQNTDEFKDLVQQKIDDEGATQSQAKALAIYETIVNSAADATKALNDESESLQATQEEISARLRQVREDIATSLTPTLLNLSENVLANVNVLLDDNLDLLTKIRFVLTGNQGYADLIRANSQVKTDLETLIPLWEEQLGILEDTGEELNKSEGIVSGFQAIAKAVREIEKAEKKRLEAEQKVRKQREEDLKNQLAVIKRNATDFEEATDKQIDADIAFLDNLIATNEKAIELSDEQFARIEASIDLDNEETLNKIENDKKKTDSAIQSAKEQEEAILAAQSAIVNATIAGIQLLAETDKDNVEFQKNLAIAQIVIAQGVSAANAIRVATSSSATTFDLIANLALALGSVLAAFSQIKSLVRDTQIPSFDKGVAEFEGGVAKVHKDEYMVLPPGTGVTTKKASNRYSDIIQSMNDGSFDSLLYEKYIRPERKSFADNLVKSLELNGVLADEKMLSEIKKGNMVNVTGYTQLAKILTKRHIRL